MDSALPEGVCECTAGKERLQGRTDTKVIGKKKFGTENGLRGRGGTGIRLFALSVGIISRTSHGI